MQFASILKLASIRGMADAVYTQTHTDGGKAFGMITVEVSFDHQGDFGDAATFYGVFEIYTAHDIGQPGSVSVEETNWAEVDRNFRVSFSEGSNDAAESMLFASTLSANEPDVSSLLRLVRDVE